MNALKVLPGKYKINGEISAYLLIGSLYEM